MIEKKIAKIVAIASGVKECEEGRETDLCQINTILACNRCLTAQLIALIAEEQKLMREALETIRLIAAEQQEDWIAIDQPYLPERILPYREIQIEAYTALKGGSYE